MQFPSLARKGAALALLCLTTGASWSAPEKGTTILHYECRMTGIKKPMRFERKIWVKGEKYRVEVYLPEGKSITVGGPKGMYVVPPGSKEATHISKPAHAEKGIWFGLFGDMAAIRREKKVGAETLAGRSTEIFEQRLSSTPGLPNVNGSTRVWLAKDMPMPFKVVTKLQPGTETILVLKSIRLDAPIPDSMFELPKGISIRPPLMLPNMIPADKLRRGLGGR
jgi:outer membrane lipoprotein-sorting protein